MEKWDEIIYNRCYMWEARYGNKPDTIIMSTKDYHMLEFSVLYMSPQFNNIVTNYMGMDIIKTHDLEVGDIRVCKSKL